MKKVISALKFGFRTVSSKPKLVVPFYLVNLILSGLIALPIASMINHFAGDSSASKHAALGLDFNLLFEFVVHNLNGLQSLEWMVVVVPVVFIVAVMFLSAGTISAISFSARVDYPVFMSQAMRYFGRYIRLVLLSIPLLLLLISIVFLADLVEWIAFRSDPLERISYWFGWARLGLGFLGLATYGMILDYARIDVILKGEKRVRKSLKRAIKFIFAHLPKTFSLTFSLALAGAILLTFYFLGSHVLRAPHWLIIAVLFVYQQAYLVARIVLKIATYAAETRLYRSF